MIEKIATLESIEVQIMHLTKHICWGEIGYSGLAFVDFIEQFTIYCESNKLTKNENITNMLSVLVKSQERNDMLFVADILQYELIPYLKKLETDCLK